MYNIFSNLKFQNGVKVQNLNYSQQSVPNETVSVTLFLSNGDTYSYDWVRGQKYNTVTLNGQSFGLHQYDCDRDISEWANIYNHFVQSGKNIQNEPFKSWYLSYQN